MAYKYKLVENDEEIGTSSVPKENPKVTLIVKDVNAALTALDDIKNYGEHAVTNARQDSNVNKSLEQIYGPKIPTIKNEQEKLFPIKSKDEWINYFVEKKRKANLGKTKESPEVILADIEAKYDTLKNNNGKYLTKTGGAEGSFTKNTLDISKKSKPTLLPKPEIKGNKIIFNKIDDGPSLNNMEKIIRTVMNTAKIEDYKLEGEKELKATKKSQLKEIIKSEIRSLLNENEENGSITIEGISATGKGYTVWKGSNPIGDLRQKISSYPKNDFGKITVNGKPFDFYYVTQIKTDKLPYIKSIKDHVGRAAYFTVSAPQGSVSKEDLKATAENILEKNKNQDGITKW